MKTTESTGTVLARTRRCLTAVSVILLGVMAGAAQESSPDAPKNAAPKKVSYTEATGAAITKVAPVYPPIARQLKLAGVVELEAVVNQAGAVEQVNIVSGNPVLTKSASEALKKWKFKPFQSDGKAVKVVAQVSMSFKL